MTTRIATWGDLSRLDGRLLLILNNREANDPTAGALWDALTCHADKTSILVAADRAWSSWIGERGLSSTSVRFAADRFGAPLEINYFLEQPETLRWVRDAAITTIVGSSPHNLYNEEVQHVFERRVAFLIGESGHLLAHTLPNQYVYLFSLTDLLERMGRDEQAERYRSSVRSLVDDLHRLWTALGQPEAANDSTYNEVRQVIASHLGQAILDYDEKSRVPIPRLSSSSGVAGLIEELRASYLRLADEHVSRTATVALREDARDLLHRLRGRRP